MIPVALDQHPAATGAVGALVLPVADVSRVNVEQPAIAGDVAGHGQRRCRGRPAVRQAEIRMEGAEVQGNVGPQLLDDPVAHPAQLVRRVVRLRDHQVGDFHPDVALVDEPAKGIEDRAEVAAGELPVELLAEALQIDVGRVHELVERLPRRRRDVPGGHGHGLDAQPAALPGGVDGVLGPHDRVVVGEGHALAAELLGGAGDILGRGRVAQQLDLAQLGDGPVLAELTAQVAAGRAERENRGPRIELVERLLFDGIDAEAGAPAVGSGDHPAAAVLTHEAETAVVGPEGAAPRTEVANDPPTVGRLVPPAAGLGAVRSGFFVRR